MKKIKPEARSKPWFNDDIIHARKSKRAAERAWRSHKNPESLLKYKEAALQYKNTILAAKKNSYDKRIKEAQSSSRELFKIVKELESSPQITPDAPFDDSWCQSILDAFKAKTDSHRASINKKLASLHSHPESISPGPCHNIRVSPPVPFSFKPVTVEELTSIVRNMKPTFCKGDYFPASAFRECIDSLAPLITRIVNASFEDASVPISLKQAWIKPLLKKSTLDPASANNYRPITSVPFLLKILDQVAYLQIQDFLETHGLLGSHQSGFRARHGTETALINLKANLSKIAEKGKPALLMLLDLSAAFDLVDHGILVSRLMQSACFSKAASDWIASFLSQRSARVFLGQHASSSTILDCGVPQGSCLSPTLYNVYTRPLFDLLDSMGICYTNYADDTQLVFELLGDHIKDSAAVNDIFEIVQRWMIQNSLALNDSKTELLVVGTAPRLKKLSSDFSHFTIAGCPIKVMSRVRTLGVVFDSHLDMNAHVKHLKSSCAYYCRLLRQIRPYLSEESASHVARALVVSRLDYCNGVLAGTSTGNLHTLQIIQNNAVRAVKMTGRREHITQHRKDLHWLPVKHRINHKIVSLVHKCRSEKAPSYLSARLAPAQQTRMTRSNKEHMLYQPRHKLQSFGASMFDVAAPRIWNDLPDHLREINSLEQFKKEVKTFYFNLH